MNGRPSRRRAGNAARSTRQSARRLLGWLAAAGVCTGLAGLAVVFGHDWAAWAGGFTAACCYREALLIALWDHEENR